MDKLKDLLHELRCDIAAIPENEENKTEIENAQETLSKAWTELLRLYNVVGQSGQLKMQPFEKPPYNCPSNRDCIYPNCKCEWYLYLPTTAMLKIWPHRKTFNSSRKRCLRLVFSNCWQLYGFKNRNYGIRWIIE